MESVFPSASRDQTGGGEDLKRFISAHPNRGTWSQTIGIKAAKQDEVMCSHATRNSC